MVVSPLCSLNVEMCAIIQSLVNIIVQTSKVVSHEGLTIIEKLLLTHFCHLFLFFQIRFQINKSIGTSNYVESETGNTKCVFVTFIFLLLTLTQ